MMKKKHRKNRQKIKRFPRAAIVLITIGLIIMMYPVVSNAITVRQQENVIAGYEKMVLQLDDSYIMEEWEKAEIYNQNKENYAGVLNLEGDGVMGYIKIPKIDINIPIYHYVKEQSLKKGIGHIKSTGLPIGGKNNHPVLFGHRGLPNAKLFLRLDEMEIGDCFYLNILNRIMAYEVKQITIVLPEEVYNIKEEWNKDQVTLVTCTPYGVNTHRLLVTGERTDYIEEIEEEQDVNRSDRNIILVLVIVMVSGIVIFLYPVMAEKTYDYKIEKQKNLYFKNMAVQNDKIEKLYSELKKRNTNLYEDRQRDFKNVTAYQKSNINLRIYGIYNNIIAYISIPEMKIQLPIYLGASEENMKKGAVHLTETSYPIGGENTNCVIAAHRGYAKASMFREIEKLEIGDRIYIENFREKLAYKVVQLRIISPSDTKQVLIREGKDMLTLITCHPYRKNSQRYVVFCERI